MSSTAATPVLQGAVAATPTGRFATNQQLMRAIGHGGETHRAPHRGNSANRGQDAVALENARLKARNDELERALTRVDEGGGSKNKTRLSIKDLPESDKLNIAQVNEKIDTMIWNKQPMRPQRWAHFTLLEKTMCQEILASGIAIPAGSTPIKYWNGLMVRSVNNKYAANKSNLFEACKRQYYADHAKGELMGHNEGKILLEIRNWKESDDLLEYEEMKPLLRFLDKYVRHNWNADVLGKWKRHNPQKPLVDKLGYRDLALVTLVYETKRAIWAEDMVEKETGSVVRQATMTYHLKKGARCKKNSDAWTDAGRAYYKELCTEFKRVWTHRDFKDSLVENWRAYEAEHYKKSYKRKRSPVEEVETEEVTEADLLMDDDDDDVPPLPPLGGNNGGLGV